MRCSGYRSHVIALVAICSLFLLSGAQDSRPDPCRPEFAKNAEQNPLGYQPRNSGGDDPCCEGTYRQLVSSSEAPQLHVLSVRMKATRVEGTLPPACVVTWPFVGSRTTISARPRNPQIHYRLDAAEGTPFAPDETAPEREVFRWKTDHLGKLAATLTDFRWQDVEVLVEARFDADAAQARGWPARMAGQPVYLPYVLHAGSAANRAKDEAAAPATRSELAGTVQVEVLVAATQYVKIESARLIKIGAPQAEPIELKRSAMPQALSEAQTRSFQIDLPRDGSLWELSIAFLPDQQERARLQAAPAIFVMAPPDGFAEWAREQ